MRKHRFLKFLGGLAGHCILLPTWVLAPFPTIAAVAVLANEQLGEQQGYDAMLVLLAQLACMGAAYKLAPSVSHAGPACAAAALSITATAAARAGIASTVTLCSAVMALTATINWGITLPYSPTFCRLLHTTFDLRGYYPQCELRGAARLSNAKRTLFLFHPHGVFTVGFSGNGCWSSEFHEAVSGHTGAPETWEDTIFLIAQSLREMSVLFKLVCDWSGRIESATRTVISTRMREGRNIALLPGGFEDATIFAYGKHRTAISTRTGVIKYALEHGYKVQPIYTFGEERTFYTFTGLMRARLWLNTFGVPAVVLFGLPLFPLLPKRARCLSYVGQPIQLPRTERPSREAVAAWHAKYVAAVQALFDESKADAGQPDAKLEIW